MSKLTAWDKVITVINRELANAEEKWGIDSIHYRTLEKLLIKIQLERTDK